MVETEGIFEGCTRELNLSLYKDKTGIYMTFLLGLLWSNFLLVVAAQLGGAKSNSGNQWWWNIDEGIEKNVFLILFLLINVRYIYNRWKRSYLVNVKVFYNSNKCKVELQYIHNFKFFRNIHIIDCKEHNRIRVDCTKLAIIINGEKEYNVLNRGDCKKVMQFINNIFDN